MQKHSNITFITGFTLVELMVTIAIAAILATLAAPNISAFVRRADMQNTSGDFITALQRARQEAVGRNSCATVCVGRLDNTGTPKCNASASDDWNENGWLVYLNPTCDSTPTNGDPSDSTNLFIYRPPGKSVIVLGSAGTNSFTFRPQGTLPLSSTSKFNLQDTQNTNSPLNRSICIDKLGRTRIITEAASC
jgi:type IV fimbrial biogenesis protein FimT